MSGLRLGITLGLRSSQESVWDNGIKQNALFLALALRRVPGVASVVLVNMTDVDPQQFTGWDQGIWPIVRFAEAKDQLDVLIELGGQLDEAQTTYLKNRGTRLVSYCCGSEYVTTMESVLFRRSGSGSSIFINPRYDQVWLVPQVAATSRYYFEVLRRVESRVVPFVWDPCLLNEQTRHLPQAGVYQPSAGARRVSVMEPNINVVKFCLYPILIAEMVYRSDPACIAHMHVCNAIELARESSEFVSLMSGLDLVKNGKISFVQRFNTPEFLSEMTDLVISHQWGNPLNYFYLEVCWQGYPLVHNADLCRDLGYYYPGNDVRAGAQAMHQALAEHDVSFPDYLQRQRATIARYSPSHDAVTHAYAGLLAALMARPLR